MLIRAQKEYILEENLQSGASAPPDAAQIDASQTENAAGTGSDAAENKTPPADAGTEPQAAAAETAPQGQQAAGGEYVLECRGLGKTYSGTHALDGVDLRIPAGGVVGLLGPNGSGKSTLIKLAMGMRQPSAGEIFICGQAPSAETKAVTAYLPDAFFFPLNMSVKQALDYMEDFFADFRRDRAEEMLSRLGVSLKQRMRALSKGNKEKVGLIMTMARRAKLYILDEPIAGVDPAARDYILQTILTNRAEGATILLCTHLIADIEPVLTHAVFLCRGKIVLDRNADEVRAETGKSLDGLFREVFKW